MRNSTFWSRNGDAFVGGMLILVVLAAGYGWVANIYKLAAVVAEPITGIFILRCIGVVMVPLGSILGFC